VNVLPPGSGDPDRLETHPDVAALASMSSGARGDDSVAIIRHAALMCFAERGYDGTTMRQIASDASMSLAGIYHHFPAKIDILFAIVHDSLLTMVDQTEDARESADKEAIEQLQAIMTAHVDYHINHQLEAFVGAYELRSFTGEQLSIVSKLRRRQQDLFDEAVRGVAALGYPVIYQDEVSRAIVSMGMEVARWYRPGGPLAKAEVIKRYAEIALVLVGVPPDEITAHSHNSKEPTP
jgi:AcrR family transcriptional regulator